MLRDVACRRRLRAVQPLADEFKLGVYRAIKMVVDPLRKSEGFRRWIRGLVRGKDANYYYEAGKAKKAQ